MNICIISYYGPRETIKLAENALSKKNFNVFDFPLFQYMIDKNHKVDNYDELVKKFIFDNKINIVLWWFVNIPTNIFINIKKDCNVIYALFNWDDPYNWKDCDIINKMPYIDYAFITCKESIEIYQKNGTKKAICLYPGFDSSVNHIEYINIEDYNKYSCDISFCCTNLYDNDELYPNQYIKRRKLIDDIYQNQTTLGYKFYIYGPEFLNKLYPNSYRGFAQYDCLNKIFNYSKINLCTHVLYNFEGYLNERVFLVGASGGLLLVDYVKGIEDVFTPNEEILILDKYLYIEQIKNILDNYDKYVRIRKNFHKKCNQLYNYDKWAETIMKTIYNSI